MQHSHWQVLRHLRPFHSRYLNRHLSTTRTCLSSNTPTVTYHTRLSQALKFSTAATRSQLMSTEEHPAKKQKMASDKVVYFCFCFETPLVWDQNSRNAYIDHRYAQRDLPLRRGPRRVPPPPHQGLHRRRCVFPLSLFAISRLLSSIFPIDAC